MGGFRLSARKVVQVNSERWILQTTRSQIGNTSVMMPALRALAEITGAPVPIYYETPDVAAIYRDAPFLKRLTALPSHAPFFTSDHGDCGRYSIVEYYASLVRAVGYTGQTPAQYVDDCRSDTSIDVPENSLAVCHGGRLEHQKPEKDITAKSRIELVKAAVAAGLRVFVLGHMEDYDRWWRPIEEAVGQDVAFCVGLPIRSIVGIGQRCKWFVSNDTGFSHVLGAWGTRGLILGNIFRHQWKHLYPNVRYVIDSSANRTATYLDAIHRFLKGADEQAEPFRHTTIVSRLRGGRRARTP